MQNHISLRPNPAVTSYLEHFQVAQVNLNLFLQEEKPQKRRKILKRHMKNKHVL
jgi:hypothetical protein